MHEGRKARVERACNEEEEQKQAARRKLEEDKRRGDQALNHLLQQASKRLPKGDEKDPGTQVGEEVSTANHYTQCVYSLALFLQVMNPQTLRFGKQMDAHLQVIFLQYFSFFLFYFFGSEFTDSAQKRS